MLNFSLNSFIKICLMDTGQHITEIQKRLSSTGGYDFYHTMQKAVRLHASGQVEEAIALVQTPVNAVERKHNLDAFKSFTSKFGSAKTLEPLNEKIAIQFDSAGISISFDPLFETSKGDVRQAYSLWATQTPLLTQRYGAVACHLMQQAYSKSPLGNASFFFTDLVNGKTYSEKQINNNTSLILSADLKSIGTLTKEL